MRTVSRQIILTTVAISDVFRQGVIFKEAEKSNPQLVFSCFRYIPDYAAIRQTLPEKGVSLVSKYGFIPSSVLVVNRVLFTERLVTI